MSFDELTKYCTIEMSQSKYLESREVKLAVALSELLDKFEINGLDKEDPDITFFGSIDDLREAQHVLIG